MTKKEFKKKCKQEKTVSYKLMLSGGAVSTIGLIVVIATMVFVKGFTTQIAGYIIGAVIALVGLALDIAGEISLSQSYKAYIGKNKS